MTNKTESRQNFVLVNENKIRLTSLSILILTLIYLFNGSWLIPAFLVLDSFARSFNLSKYSILNILSINLVNFFSLEVNPVNKAPSRFSSKIGLLLGMVIIAAHLLNLKTTAIIFSVILALFAFLESVGYCVSCHFHTWYESIFRKNNHPVTDQM